LADDDDLDSLLAKLEDGKKEEKEETEETKGEEPSSSSEEEKLKKAKDELTRVATELDKKRAELAKREEEVLARETKTSEKEAHIKKATELLLRRREETDAKEKKIVGLKDGLKKEAEVLKEKEDQLSKLKEVEEALDKREMEVSGQEEGMRKREHHLKEMESRIADCPRCASHEGYVKSERLLNDLKELGFALEEEEQDLKDIQKLIDDDKRDEAISKAERLIKKLRELHDEVVIKGIRYNFTRAKWLLSYAQGQNIGPEIMINAEGHLGRAHQFIQTEDYKSADWYVREATISIENALRGIGPGTGAQPEAVAPPAVTRTYVCPNCNQNFTVDSIERPIRAVCPGCQTTLVVVEEIKYG
jgi:hypothetical protein